MIKALVELILRALGYDTFQEEKYCDVVGRKFINGRNYLLGVEVQMSVGHLLVNVRKFFALGGTHLIVVTPDARVKGQCERKLERELSEELKGKVEVVVVKV